MNATWPPRLGIRLRTRVEFSGVPIGTTCTVVEHYGADRVPDREIEGLAIHRPAGVMVEWDRPIDVRQRMGRPPHLGPVTLAGPQPHGLRDGFSADEIDAFLEAL